MGRDVPEFEEGTYTNHIYLFETCLNLLNEYPSYFVHK
jgi:hypothetical protein